VAAGEAVPPALVNLEPQVQSWEHARLGEFPPFGRVFTKGC
jgi:hypothetical protein